MSIILVIIGLIALAVIPLIIFLRMLATYNFLQACLAICGFIGWVIFYPILVLNGVRLMLAG
jgi:hypothetical protein